MNSIIIPQQSRQVSEIKYLPAVSIILPIQPLITKKQLEDKLKSIVEKTGQRLLALYCEGQASQLIIKLRNIICDLKYKPSDKGIAIFVSAAAEKVYYLNGEVKERVDIEEFFEIQGEIFKSDRQYNIASPADG